MRQLFEKKSEFICVKIGLLRVSSVFRLPVSDTVFT